MRLELRTSAEIATEIMQRSIFVGTTFKEIFQAWNATPESGGVAPVDRATDLIQNILDEEFRSLSLAEKAAAGATSIESQTVTLGDTWGNLESEVGVALITDIVHETVSRACLAEAEGKTVDAEFIDDLVDEHVAKIARRTKEALHGRGFRV